MNISSILVSAAPERAGQVKSQLEALAGVEVHAVSDDGRLIVTIEADSEQATVSTFEAINQQPHVLAVSLVYHQDESDPDEEA